MNSRAENFYAVWRERCRAVNVLRDAGSAPPEKLLQAVWQHQRLRRDQLKTADGKSVRVLHPGFASAEGGPDFRGAVLQIGDEEPVPATWKLICSPAAGARTATTRIQISKTSSCTSSGTKSKVQSPECKAHPVLCR